MRERRNGRLDVRSSPVDDGEGGRPEVAEVLERNVAAQIGVARERDCHRRYPDEQPEFPGLCERAQAIAAERLQTVHRRIEASRLSICSRPTACHAHRYGAESA